MRKLVSAAESSTGSGVFAWIRRQVAAALAPARAALAKRSAPWNGDINDTARGHTDPVFYDSINREWFFYDETWTDVIGPFEDEELARAALDCYADSLDNGDDWRLDVRRRNAAWLPAALFWKYLVPGTTQWEGPYASFEDAKAARDAHRRSVESHSAPGMYGAPPGYTYETFATASGLVQEPDGSVREATPEELRPLNEAAARSLQWLPDDKDSEYRGG